MACPFLRYVIVYLLSTERRIRNRRKKMTSTDLELSIENKPKEDLDMTVDFIDDCLRISHLQ
jgi:hypothetical protein